MKKIFLTVLILSTIFLFAQKEKGTLTLIDGTILNGYVSVSNKIKFRTSLDAKSTIYDFENSKEAYQVTGDIKFYEAGLLKLNCDKALFHFQWKATLDYQTLIEFTSDWYYEFYDLYCLMNQNVLR